MDRQKKTPLLLITARQCQPTKTDHHWVSLQWTRCGPESVPRWV